MNKPKSIGKHDRKVLERINDAMESFVASCKSNFSMESMRIDVDSDGRSVIDDHRDLVFDLEMASFQFADKSLRILEKELLDALSCCIEEMCSNMSDYGFSHLLMSRLYYLDERRLSYLDQSKREEIQEYQSAKQEQEISTGPESNC